VGETHEPPFKLENEEIEESIIEEDIATGHNVL